MRDKNRIYPFLCHLAGGWEEICPDWRFGQLMLNFLQWHYHKYGTDFFYLEENEFKNRFDEYLDSICIL